MHWNIQAFPLLKHSNIQAFKCIQTRILLIAFSLDRRHPRRQYLKLIRRMQTIFWTQLKSIQNMNFNAFTQLKSIHNLNFNAFTPLKSMQIRSMFAFTVRHWSQYAARNPYCTAGDQWAAVWGIRCLDTSNWSKCYSFFHSLQRSAGFSHKQWWTELRIHGGSLYSSRTRWGLHLEWFKIFLTSPSYSVWLIIFIQWIWDFIPLKYASK